MGEYSARGGRVPLLAGSSAHISTALVAAAGNVSAATSSLPAAFASQPGAAAVAAVAPTAAAIPAGASAAAEQRREGWWSGLLAARTEERKRARNNGRFAAFPSCKSSSTSARSLQAVCMEGGFAALTDEQQQRPYEEKVAPAVAAAAAGRGFGRRPSAESAAAAGASADALEEQRQRLREDVADSDFGDDGEVDDNRWFCSFFLHLTYTERLLGWLTCFLGGLIVSSLSIGSFYDMFSGRSMNFAFAYTLGNCLGLLGTTFLVGPIRQLEGMADPSRFFISVVFACSLLLTLFFAVVLPFGPLLLLCVCTQWLAYIWYSLSYIPGAQYALYCCMQWIAARFR